MNYNDDFSKLEKHKIEEIKREYEKKGYTATVEPTLAQRPSFLKNYTPDLIAISEKESVMIEVKSSVSLHKAGYLSKLAETAQKNGWRFELVITNRKSFEQSRMDCSLNKEEIIARMREIPALLELNYYNAAYLVSWSVFEAALRVKMAELKLDSHAGLMTLIKNLYSYGLVSRPQYEDIEKKLTLRNSLVHGFAANINHTDINFITDLTTKLLQDE